MCNLKKSNFLTNAYKFVTRFWSVFVVIGFIIGAIIQMLSIETAIDLARRAESISLARNLYSEYSKNELFLKIEKSIVNEEILYGEHSGKNGKYNWQEINLYLGFFEEIGFFYRIDAFDISVVDFYFGGRIIKAYLDDDVRAYVIEARRNGRQPAALEEFQRVAERLSDLPHRAAYIEEHATGYKRWDEKL